MARHHLQECLSLSLWTRHWK